MIGQHERALMASETAQAIKVGDYHAPGQNWFQQNKFGKGDKGKGRGKYNPFADQMADDNVPWERPRRAENWDHQKKNDWYKKKGEDKGRGKDKDKGKGSKPKGE